MVQKMNCKQVQRKLSDYVDRNLSDSEKMIIENHLDDCRNCSSEFASLQAILTEASKMDNVTAPDVLWEKIEYQLDAGANSLLSRISASMSHLKAGLQNAIPIPMPVLRMAGVISVLIIGVLIGRFFYPTEKKEVTVPTAEVQDGKMQLLSERTVGYVDKSKILFLGLVNANPEELKNSDLSSEKRLARNLIAEASFLKENLSPKSNASIIQLVDELEMILYEIANLEEQQDIDNIELIKSGIDRKGLLLKINLYDLDEIPVMPENKKQKENLL